MTKPKSSGGGHSMTDQRWAELRQRKYADLHTAKAINKNRLERLLREQGKPE